MFPRPRPRVWTPTAQSLAIIVACLQKRERNHRLKAIVLALLGVVFCSGAVLLLGSMAWALQSARRGRHLPTHVYPWLPMVLITGALILPLLFLLEWSTRGMFLEDAVDSLSDTNYFVRRRAGGLVIIEMCLWGPRMIMSAFRRHRACRSYTGHDLNLASGMLATLLRDENGMPTGQVLGDASDAAVSTMTYLTFYDWIDISKSGDRVWLLSDAREVLRFAVRQK
jgi:hypothetical protein